MKKASYCKIILLIMAFFCFLQVDSFASIPKAGDDYYLDQLDVLDEKTKDNINRTNRQLEDKTGSQVVVMTLYNPNEYDGNAYGTEIFNQWKIGDKKKNNGVLILFLDSKKDGGKQINIITGYGIEGRLNDGKLGRIIDNFMLDYLKSGAYSKGINEGFNAVVGEICKEYDISLDKDYSLYQDRIEEDEEDEEDGFSLSTMIIILVIFIIISNIINKNNRGGGFGGRRRRLYYPGSFTGGSSWGSSFGGGSSGGGFSGGGGSSGGGGAGRSF